MMPAFLKFVVSDFFFLFLLVFSSWAEQGVDPSLFPRELMDNVSSIVEDEEVVLYPAAYDPNFTICN